VFVAAAPVGGVVAVVKLNVTPLLLPPLLAPFALCQLLNAAIIAVCSSAVGKSFELIMTVTGAPCGQAAPFVAAKTGGSEQAVCARVWVPNGINQLATAVDKQSPKSRHVRHRVGSEAFIFKLLS